MVGGELRGNLAMVLDEGNGDPVIAGGLFKSAAESGHRVNEVMAGNEVDTHLEDQQKNRLGDFGVKLFLRTEDAIAVAVVHGRIEHAVDHHENDDKELKDAEVGLPEGAAVGIVFKQEGLEEEDDAEERQEHVGGSEVHQVESQADGCDAERGVNQRVLINSAEVRVKLRLNAAEFGPVVKSHQDARPVVLLQVKTDLIGHDDCETEE